MSFAKLTQLINYFLEKNMPPLNQLDQLAARLTALLPASAQHVKQDIEDNMRTGLENGLRTMNLVTREEFDIQNAVLLRTREKLEKLEEAVEMLERQIKNK